MAVDWSEPKIEHEKVKIEPEKLIEDARKYAEDGDYNMAERMYVNALSNARGTSNVKEIVKAVKVELIKIYKLWTRDCIRRYEFQEAEPVLQKLLKISDDKKATKEEFIMKLYETWGFALSFYDKNCRGALIVYIKELKLKMELGLSTTYTESEICRLLFSSDNPSYRKKATEINFGKKEARIRLLISAVLMTAMALLAPIFAPASMVAYILFPLFILPIRTAWDWDPLSCNKMLRKGLGITFFALIWTIFWVLCGTSGSWSDVANQLEVLNVITLVFVICISFRVLLFAISQFKIYFSYQEQDTMDVLKDLFPSVIVLCKSCSTKLRVPGEIISAVKCPKCGNLVRKAVDLQIKNKPSSSSNMDDGGQLDSEYTWGRVGFLLGKSIVTGIINNIRF